MKELEELDKKEEVESVEVEDMKNKGGDFTLNNLKPLEEDNKKDTFIINDANGNIILQMELDVSKQALAKAGYHIHNIERSIKFKEEVSETTVIQLLDAISNKGADFLAVTAMLDEEDNMGLLLAVMGKLKAHENSYLISTKN